MKILITGCNRLRMLRVKYERHWNDFVRKSEEKRFQDLEDLENWMFGQMEQDYTKDFVMGFPTPEKAERIGDVEGAPWRIELRPKWGGESLWIKQIQSDNGIIFSDGTFTSGHSGWRSAGSPRTWRRRLSRWSVGTFMKYW